uniref:Uncharacterized protein n=1 Tax=Salix viminalis TaxID=40686 RepID=A0A6N2L283_SALVM
MKIQKGYKNDSRPTAGLHLSKMSSLKTKQKLHSRRIVSHGNNDEGLYLSRICYRVDSVKQKVDDIFQPRKNRFLIHFVKGSSLKEVLDKDRQLLQGHLKLVLIKLQHWKVFSTFLRLTDKNADKTHVLVS